MTVNREGTEARDNYPDNEKAVRFINGRLADLLSELIHHRNGELHLRILAVDGKLKHIEFSPIEKHRF